MPRRSVGLFKYLAASAAGGVEAGPVSPLEVTTLSSPTTLLPFQPIAMSPAQLAAVSYLPTTPVAPTTSTRSSYAAGSPGARATASIR
jgi:hypothetical protein